MTAEEIRACDLLVVGAGAAGVPAAVAAARAGLNTVLVEERAIPGGAGITGAHREICGLFAQSDSPLLLNRGGLVEEIGTSLAGGPPEEAALRRGRVFVLPFELARLEAVFTGLIAGEERLDARIGIAASNLAMEGRRVAAVGCGVAGRELTVVPKVVIDASGAGALLGLIGSGFDLAPDGERQLAGYHCLLKGIAETDELLPIVVPFCLNREVQKGGLPDYLKFTTFFADAEGGTGGFRLNVPVAPRAGRLERTQNEAREVHRILRREIAALRDSEIVRIPSHIDPRDGRRLAGLATLTEDDVTTGRVAEGEAVRGAWPIEFWDRSAGTQFRYLDDGAESYAIPVGCLRSAEVCNLLAAGRCLSATPRALASARVMGSCMALGEMAGREAARLVLSGEVS